MTQTLAPPAPQDRSSRTARLRRATSHGRPGWSASVLLIAAAVVGPVAAVLIDVVNGELPDWPRNLDDMVVTTLLLMAGVGVGTLVLGCGLAWLVTAYTFPLRNVLVWLLVLPLAMPKIGRASCRERV